MQTLTMLCRAPRPETRYVAHLVLLGEPQVVVGFEQLDVLGQLADGDGRVAHHSCDNNKGGSGGGGGQR